MKTKYNYKYLEDEWTRGYWDFIQNNQDKFWNWHYMSKYPNITWDIIQNNPDKPWNWSWISLNPMVRGKAKWINDKRLQIIKALQILRHWRNCSCNPEYILAQQLIIKRLRD